MHDRKGATAKGPTPEHPAINLDDGPLQDPSGRLRTSHFKNLYESVRRYGLLPLLWETLAAGTGATETVTHDANRSAAKLSISGEDGAEVTHQGPYATYQSGKGILDRYTLRFGERDTNVIKRGGYFDDDDGIFLEQNGADDELYWVLRSSVSGTPVDTKIAQSDWNRDMLDGTGNANNPSGLLLNEANAQFCYLDFNWFSLGRVRVGFIIDGQAVDVHHFNTSNESTDPFMATPHLPMRYQMLNDGAATGTNTMLAICDSIDSEGGHDPIGFPQGTSTGNDAITATTTELNPILSIRPKATFNGVTFRGQIRPPREGNLATLTTSQLSRLVLVVGADLTGTQTWQSVGDSSVAEYAVHDPSTEGIDVAAGRVIEELMVSASGPGSNATGGLSAVTDLTRVGLRNAADPNDADFQKTYGQLTLAVIGIDTAPDVTASLNWVEVY